MAKRKAHGQPQARRPDPARESADGPRSAKRPTAQARAQRKAEPAAAKQGAAAPRKAAHARRRQRRQSAGRQRRRRRRQRPPKRAAARAKAQPAGQRAPRTAPRLDRARRTLDEDRCQTPPSSLDMDRRGSAARTGRAEIAETLARPSRHDADITGGDVDADVEDAYFSGDEAPGGDNPTPDQDIVDDIGKALGVEYQDNEELEASDKVVERDKHRWELDPASAEDYKERKK